MGKIGGDDGGYAFDVGDFRCFDPADALPANDLVQFPFPFMDVFADFMHRHLLPHPQVSQVRSEIVLKTLKDEAGVPVV